MATQPTGDPQDEKVSGVEPIGSPTILCRVRAKKNLHPALIEFWNYTASLDRIESAAGAIPCLKRIHRGGLRVPAESRERRSWPSFPSGTGDAKALSA